MPTAQRHIALLRGINVGGRNKLPMNVLAPLFEAAGCSHVRTYIQSGNVIFAARPDAARQMAAEVSKRIKAKCKLDVPVVVRTKKEWNAIVAGNPFFKRGADEANLHVICLADKPTKTQVASLDPNRSPGDELFVQGKDIYLHLPNGVARSKLTNAYFDKTFGTVSTGRNWRTVLKLQEMVELDE